MTRDEALSKMDPLAYGTTKREELLDCLVALGLLHLEPAIASQEDTVRIAAVERLTGAWTMVLPTGNSMKISRRGASEILDVLTKSGFRITKVD